MSPAVVDLYNHAARLSDNLHVVYDGRHYFTLHPEWTKLTLGSTGDAIFLSDVRRPSHQSSSRSQTFQHFEKEWIG